MPHHPNYSYAFASPLKLSGKDGTVNWITCISMNKVSVLRRVNYIMEIKPCEIMTMEIAGVIVLCKD